MHHRLIIALPSRLLAMTLAHYMVQWSKEIEVHGIATNCKELFNLLDQLPAKKEKHIGSVLIYDPYLPGPCPEVIFSHINNQFYNLNTILMKNENSNGRFAEAQKCSPTAIIGSDAQPEELLHMVMTMSTNPNKQPKTKPAKHTALKNALPEEKKSQLMAVLSARE